jgi:hypothetical protein
MATGDTKLSICSDALIMLGSSPLSSFSEGSDAAQITDRLYDDIQDTVLMSYPWAFSLKKSQLARSVDAPTAEYQYQYPLPADLIGSGPRALFTSSGTGTRPVTFGWEVYGGNILTNYATVYIDYQFRPEPDVMPTYFIQLLKYWVAWHIAEPVTDQITKAQYFQSLAVGSAAENMRGGMMRQAMQIDGASEPISGFQDFPLITARAS